MAKGFQAELFKRRLEFQRTELNIKEFKKCFESLYKNGMVSEETIKRVRGYGANSVESS